MYRHLQRTYIVIVLAAVIMAFLAACEEEHEHTAPAVNPRDSVPTMVTYGVNTLISDSGVIKYRIVTEESRTVGLRQGCSDCPIRPEDAHTGIYTVRLCRIFRQAPAVAAARPRENTYATGNVVPERRALLGRDEP